jgi:hypothetical protein
MCELRFCLCVWDYLWIWLTNPRPTRRQEPCPTRSAVPELNKTNPAGKRHDTICDAN